MPRSNPISILSFSSLTTARFFLVKKRVNSPFSLYNSIHFIDWLIN